MATVNEGQVRRNLSRDRKQPWCEKCREPTTRLNEEINAGTPSLAERNTRKQVGGGKRLRTHRQHHCKQLGEVVQHLPEDPAR